MSRYVPSTLIIPLVKASASVIISPVRVSTMDLMFSESKTPRDMASNILPTCDSIGTPWASSSRTHVLLRFTDGYRRISFPERATPVPSRYAPSFRTFRTIIVIAHRSTSERNRFRVSDCGDSVIKRATRIKVGNILDDVAVTIATIDGQCFLDFHVVGKEENNAAAILQFQ
ncbi:hypothetical protein ALC56_09685 [Trachymyrmex septentrionalis]|uniref:Uncharacterized protein n=1 Tax=Trachymyrmex septentrionalis TaxID=34720 RepID=A0A195F746_9HYME|nr:hypothetical protein ALC56_09685 [Trachymyrmex septentrionalis]